MKIKFLLPPLSFQFLILFLLLLISRTPLSKCPWSRTTPGRRPKCGRWKQSNEASLHRKCTVSAAPFSFSPFPASAIYVWQELFSDPLWGMMHHACARDQLAPLHNEKHTLGFCLILLGPCPLFLGPSPFIYIYILFFFGEKIKRINFGMKHLKLLLPEPGLELSFPRHGGWKRYY